MPAVARTLTVDPLFVGATRPPMRWGVTYAALLANLVITMEVFLLSRNLLMLGIADSLGGAVIGLLKGFVFVEIALIVAITFPSLHLEGPVHRSLLAPFFLDSVPVLTNILPGEFKNAVTDF